MRILYYAINGSGLGHLTRLSAIVLAVRQQVPDVHQLMVTSANYPPLLTRLRMPSIILPHDGETPLLAVDRRQRTVSAKLVRQILSDTVRAYDPKVLVFDTHAPWGLVDEARKDGRQPVLVLRHCRDEVIAKLLSDGTLSRFSLVLLPHSREQLAAIIAAATLRQLDNLSVVRYVGGIAFPTVLNAAEIERVAARHGIANGERLILVCAGSGGYRAINRRFFEKACRAAVAYRGDDPSVHVVCIAGPFADAMPSGLNCTVVDAEPELQLLMARADLVISHGGYNSVQEVLRTSSRAVLVPMPRGAEDQAALVGSLLPRSGTRAVALGASDSVFERALHHALREPRPQPVAADGAVVAAGAILELEGVPDVYICTRAPTSARSSGRRAGPQYLARSLKQNGSQARLCIDWDVTGEILGRLGPGARARVVSIEVHLGRGGAQAWEDRILQAYETIVAMGFEPGSVTFSFEDASGGPDIVELAERVSQLRFRSLVAQVPIEVLHTQPVHVFEAAERCRALQLPFSIDITVLENPVSFVDQP
jgi:predicted glycosyltransferase